MRKASQLIFADQIRLVAAGVEISVPDLAVVIRPYRVIPLADMNQNGDVVRQTLDSEVDDVHGRGNLLIA